MLSRVANYAQVDMLGVWYTSINSSQLGVWYKFIVSHGIIKGEGLQFPGTNFVDKTLKKTLNLLVKPHFWSCPESGT